MMAFEGMRHGTFTGPADLYPHLAGKTALVRDCGEHWAAQFDNVAVPEAFGWTAFPHGSFTLDPKNTCCPLCGFSPDGGPMGYVCPRRDCPHP